MICGYWTPSVECIRVGCLLQKPIAFTAVCVGLTSTFEPLRRHKAVQKYHTY